LSLPGAHPAEDGSRKMATGEARGSASPARDPENPAVPWGRYRNR